MFHEEIFKMHYQNSLLKRNQQLLYLGTKQFKGKDKTSRVFFFLSQLYLQRSVSFTKFSSSLPCCIYFILPCPFLSLLSPIFSNFLSSFFFFLFLFKVLMSFIFFHLISSIIFFFFFLAPSGLSLL